MYKDILMSKEKEGVYKITFNRPDVLNAVSNTMTIEVLDALEKLKEAGDCRVLILTGNGRSFTVGADTTAAVQLSEQDYNAYLDRFSKMLRKIESFPAPVIGMIDGFAFGGGAEVACSCDIRFGSENTRFRFPGASYGLIVSGSSLSTIVNLPKAKELLFSSAIIEAEEAYKLGLLNQLYSSEELESATFSYIDRVVENRKEVIEKTKEVLNLLVGETKSDRKQIESNGNDYLKQNTDQRDTFAFYANKRKTNRNW